MTASAPRMPAPGSVPLLENGVTPLISTGIRVSSSGDVGLACERKFIDDT